jgi:hypothetical protein
MLANAALIRSTANNLLTTWHCCTTTWVWPQLQDSIRLEAERQLQDQEEAKKQKQKLKAKLRKQKAQQQQQQHQQDAVADAPSTPPRAPRSPRVAAPSTPTQSLDDAFELATPRSILRKRGQPTPGKRVSFGLANNRVQPIPKVTSRGRRMYSQPCTTDDDDDYASLSLTSTLVGLWCCADLPSSLGV